jgi:hypothetical protein
MFAGGVLQSAFCEHARTYSLGASATVSCSSCIEGSAFDEQGVCALPDADTSDDDSRHCAAFARRPACAEPLPERARDRHRD